MAPIKSFETGALFMIFSVRSRKCEHIKHWIFFHEKKKSTILKFCMLVYV